MKKYYKNSICLFVIAQIILFAGLSSAQERDPFSPSGTGVMNRVKELVSGETTPSIENANSANPLTATQLSGYKVTGVIVSDQQKLASVKGINGVSYLVKIGDSIGSENGKVSDITFDGISVKTESQEVKLPVSNIIEVPVDSAQTKNK